MMNVLTRINLLLSRQYQYINVIIEKERLFLVHSLIVLFFIASQGPNVSITEALTARREM